MRTGIAISLSSSDHRRLVEIAADRNSPQKHVWRARIVLATADGLGTSLRVGIAALPPGSKAP